LAETYQYAQEKSSDFGPTLNLFFFYADNINIIGLNQRKKHRLPYIKTKSLAKYPKME